MYVPKYYIYLGPKVPVQGLRVRLGALVFTIQVRAVGNAIPSGSHNTTIRILCPNLPQHPVPVSKRSVALLIVLVEPFPQRTQTVAETKHGFRKA